MANHRYAQKRFSGPNKRKLGPIINVLMEKNVLVCVCYTKDTDRPVGLYLHPTKGWRTTGRGG